MNNPDCFEQLAEGDLINKYCQEIEAATYMDRIRWNSIWGEISYRDEAEKIRQFISDRKPDCSDTADKVFIGWIDEDSREEFDINSPITKDKSVIADWK